MTKVFINGSSGTTGLRIHERLAQRSDIELLTLPEDKKKDPVYVKAALHESEIAFLCLPDAAAKEAVALAEGSRVKLIDCSTAHRTSEGWAYGFPELSKAHREAIANSKRVANPGCHASGFIAGVYPLVSRGVIPADYPITSYSLTGYSGGGKSLIGEYEDENRDPRHESHRIYGLDLRHKHLPEMQKVCGLAQPPLFSPILGDFYEGMATAVLLPGFEAGRIWETLAEHYEGQKLVSVSPLGGDESVIYASTLALKDSMRIAVSGHGEQCMVIALFDNLGKGASGAAIENMNILLGLDESTGLNV